MKKVLIAAASILLIVFTILVALPSFIELNRFRGQFEASFEKALQRPVKVGDIRLSLLPGPGVRVQGVAISDRKEFGGEQAVAMEELEARLALFPLLSRKIVVRRFVAHKPVIKLVIAEDGSTNFSDLMRPRPAPPAEAPKEPSPGPAPSAPTKAAFRVDRLDIRGGDITVVDKHTVRGTTLTHRLEDLNVSLRDVSLESPIDFDVSGKLVRQTPQTFRMKGTLGPLGESPEPSSMPITISVVSKGLELAPIQPYVKDLLPIDIRAGSVTSDITLTRRKDEKLEAKGTVRFDEMDFTATATGYRPPKPLSLSVDQSVQVDLKADTIRADRFRLTLGESSLALTGDVVNTRSKPTFDIELTSDGMALEDLARLDPSLPSRLPEGLSIRGPVALDVAYKGTLSSFEAKGSLDAGRSRLGWKSLVDKAAGVPAALGFDGSYDGSRLTIGEAQLDLHTMKLDISGAVTDLAAKPSVDLKLKTNTVSLDGWGRVAPALKDNPLNGRFSVDAQVAGSTAEPTKGRLDGRVSLEGVGPVEKLFTIFPALKASWPSDLDLSGTTSAEVKFKGTMEAFDMEGQWDFRDGHFRFGTLLEKPRGEAAEAKVKGGYRKGDVAIDRLDVALKDLKATGKGTIKNIDDPLIDLSLSTQDVDIAKWAPSGKRLTGKVRLALGVRGKLNEPKALSFSKVDFAADGIGPLETMLAALPSTRASLPRGSSMKGVADVSVAFSGTYPKLSGKAVMDLSRAGLDVPEWVVKPQGAPARLAIDGRYTADALILRSFELLLDKDWIRGAAQVTNLDKPRGSLNIASSELEIEELARTLPFLRRYGLAGSVGMDIQLRGDTANLKDAQAKGRVDVRGLQAQLPQLAAPLEKMSGTLEFQGQEATLKQFTLAYGDSIVSLNATVRGFDAPVISFILDAPRLVLHQLKPVEVEKKRALAGLPPPGQDVGPTQAAQSAQAKPGSSGWFEWFKKITASGQMRSHQVIYEDWTLSNLQATTSLRRGVFLLNQLTFGLHGGRYDGSAVMDLDPASKVFSFRSQIMGVDVHELLATHAKLPNTVWGRLQADLDVKGRGASADTVLASLSGRGQATVTDGQINMALARDLLRNMPVLKLVGLIPGFQKLNYCTNQFTRQEVTPFRSMVLPVSINQGIAAVAPGTLVLDSQDIDVVTGSNPGVIDLPRQEIHLRNINAVFSPQLTDMCLGADAKPYLTDASGRMAFPFAIDGSFRDGRFPKPRPDETFILQTIQRAVAGGFLDKVFGGSRQSSPAQPAPQPGQQYPQSPVPRGLEDLIKIIK